MRLFSGVLPLLFLACNKPALTVEVTADPEVPSLLTVHWSAEEPVTGTVTVGVDGGAVDRLVAEEDAASEHQTMILGLVADQDVEIAVKTDQGEETVTVHTDANSTDVPEFTPVSGSLDGLSGYVTLPMVGGTDGKGARMVMLLDPQGRPSWFHSISEEEVSIRARLAQDGSGLVYTAEAIQKLPDWSERIHRVSWDGTDTVIETPGLHHDFVELTDQSLVYLGIEVHTLDNIALVTDTLEKVDASGTHTVLWHAWDDLEALGLQPFDPGMYASDGDMLHANHVVYLPEEDAFLVSLLRPMEVVLVDAKTGKVRWTFGGMAPDFAMGGGELPLGRIHGAALNGDQLAVFRNDRGDTQTDCSEVRLFQLDAANQTATRTDTIAQENCTWVYAFGEVEFLPADETMVAWSTSGRLARYDATGAMGFAIDAEPGNFFGYTSLIPDFLNSGVTP